MEDKRLLYLAATTSVIGLLVLAYVGPQLNPPSSKISQLDTTWMGRILQVSGTVAPVSVWPADFRNPAMSYKPAQHNC